ncbi:uncharacterized protein LOC113868743 isoform X2 [Abrus precatorius]|uniref:Uncharacterized protein LOC113868743 isoform X2 n=1 Tax=Abrus precatorius TaxID=3816 RepID=A0A8B8LXI8_ABRPR|nr:uncharacterized protein LOC113868743 isoform X2 [Abrus precatorius]
MAAGSNTGFHYDDMGSALNWHAISFQSGAVGGIPEMVPMGNYFGLNNNSNSASGMVYSGNSSIISNVSNSIISQSGSPSASSSLLLDSVPGLKHDAGLAVEWSVDEQYKLDEGLVKYADEPSIMKYIKIAATLRDKTVRDVALRCSWMTRKRRKSEEHMVKKVNNRKDKPVESSSKHYLQSTLSPSMTTYSRISNHMDKSQGICGPVKQLLEQNAQAFSQISANLSTFKLQDNIELFGQTRHNINTILNDMRKMPGIMSQMPPLPISINDDLASSILPNNKT